MDTREIASGFCGRSSARYASWEIDAMTPAAEWLVPRPGHRRWYLVYEVSERDLAAHQERPRAERQRRGLRAALLERAP